MRNSFVILLLYISLSLSGATYYIDPSGNNANTGSVSSPWKTLSYACSRVNNPGDIIHVNAGTYVEISQSNLAVGVSIMGEGVTSIILSHISSASWTIQLYSTSEGTKGNQQISYIKMDGDNLTGNRCIGIFKRSNVEIHHCTFVDFRSRGIMFDANATGVQPAIYSTGNKFHDNIVKNCSSYDPPNTADAGLYALGINGQQGMRVYDNVLDQTSRSAGSNGFLIKI